FAAREMMPAILQPRAAQHARDRARARIPALERGDLLADLIEAFGPAQLVEQLGLELRAGHRDREGVVLSEEHPEHQVIEGRAGAATRRLGLVAVLHEMPAVVGAA